jgi:tetratricopeptide (TPR) repeat protein
MRARLPNKGIVLLYLIVALLFQQGLQAQTPDAGFLAGCAYYKTGDLNRALESFNTAISRNNSDERYFIYRGRVFMQVKDYEHALKDFTEANDIVPGIADLWLAKANALSGDAGKALSFLKSHLASVFRLPEDSIKRDKAFESIHDSPGWYSLWEQEWYNDEEKAGMEVAYYLRKGTPDMALSYLNDEMTKLTPGAGLLELRAKVYLKQGNYAAAISDYTSALNMEKKGGLSQQSDMSGKVPEGSIYYNRALANLGAERYKDAVSDFSRALKEFPENFNGYLLRAQAYAGLQSYDMARKDVLFYLSFFSQDQPAIFQCGEYFYDEGDYMNALKYFNLNLKDDQVNSKYFKARGKTYLKTATYRYAISDLSMSLDLNADDAEAWMYLGLAKIQSGDKENGCSDLHKAQQLGNTEVLKDIVENCNK